MARQTFEEGGERWARWRGGLLLHGQLGCGTSVLGVHASRVKRSGRVKPRWILPMHSLPRDQGALKTLSGLCHCSRTGQVSASRTRAVLCSWRCLVFDTHHLKLEADAGRNRSASHRWHEPAPPKSLKQGLLPGSGDSVTQTQLVDVGRVVVRVSWEQRRSHVSRGSSHAGVRHRPLRNEHSSLKSNVIHHRGLYSILVRDKKYPPSERLACPFGPHAKLCDWPAHPDPRPI